MSMHPRLNRVILRFKAPGVGLITLQLCLTLYSRHHYYANAYTAIVAVLFSEGFLECASESGGRVWSWTCNEPTCVHACVCTVSGRCLVESDTSASNALQEIMEPAVNEWVAASRRAHGFISSFFAPKFLHALLPPSLLSSSSAHGDWPGDPRGRYSVWIIEARERKREGEICKLTLSHLHPFAGPAQESMINCTQEYTS